MITRFSCRFILYFDYCSFTGVDSVSLQVTGLLHAHGFIMMSPLFKAILKAHGRGADWVNKTIKKNRIWQPSVISLYTEIHEDDNDLTAFILKTKYDPRA